MQDNRNNNGGAIFPRQKRSPSSPDFGGDFTINGDVLDYVLLKAERGEEVKLEISAWRKEGRSSTFMSIAINKPYAERQGAQNEAPPPPQRQASSRTYGEDKGRPQTRTPAPQRERAPLDDEIPFGGPTIRRTRRSLDD